MMRAGQGPSQTIQRDSSTADHCHSQTTHCHRPGRVKNSVHTAASTMVVTFEHQHTRAAVAQRRGARETTEPRTDHYHVKVLSCARMRNPMRRANASRCRICIRKHFSCRCTVLTFQRVQKHDARGGRCALVCGGALHLIGHEIVCMYGGPTRLCFSSVSCRRIHPHKPRER